jgi:DNA polymerase III subunit delta'
MKKKQAPEQLILSPAANTRFLGHDAAEHTILESLRSGKMPHAWLLSGPRGIGKATFAYRIARFLFSNTNTQPESLDCNPASPIISRIAQKSYSDLLALEEPFVNDEGKPVKELSVHMVREIGKFLSLSASESPYRIIIIDSVDDMNTNAANALLKLLEEPPPHAYLFLISHSPGKVLPTIRSRCRQLKMQVPEHEHAVRIVQLATDTLTSTDAMKLLHLAGDAPGLAVTIAQHNGLALYTQLLECLATLPQLDMGKVLALAETLANKDNDARWQLFCLFYARFIETLIKRAVGDPCVTPVMDNELELIDRLAAKSSLEKWLELWENSNAMLEETNRAHLDRKQVVVLLFQMLKSIA